MLIQAVCPGCKKELPIEVPDNPSGRLIVTCDYCGLEKKLSAFQKEYRQQEAMAARLVEAKVKQAEAEANAKQLELLATQKRLEQSDTSPPKPNPPVAQTAPPSTPQVPEQQVITIQSQAWSPGIAAALSFIVPGLGQLYKGQIFNGLAWFFCTILGYMFLVVPGLILHLCCILGAASGDNKTTQNVVLKQPPSQG